MINWSAPFVRMLSFALLAIFCIQSACLASPPPAPADLNLSSSQKTINAAQLSGFAPARINVGGRIMSVTSQSMLTPAQATALMQVLSTGRQTLNVGITGTAVGGSFLLTPDLTGSFGSIVVPRNVKAFNVYSGYNTTGINGDLTNLGMVYAVSTDAAVRSVTLTASNITNLLRATITSILPATGLPGITPAVSNLDLSLVAANNIVNKGTISSSGSLSLTAGGTITADGGTMFAQNGNLNLTTVNGGDIVLNGGNYAAQSLNFNAGTGSVTAQVHNVDGVVNVIACNARVIADTALLQVGSINTTGDPTFANTGSISLNGQVTSGLPLVVVAGQNITFGSLGGTMLDTSSNTGSGGSVYLLAGAKFSPNPYISGPITILGASSTGGKVDLTGNGFTGIDTSATGATGSGGNVEIAAFAGSAAGSGQILMPSATSSITTTGSNAGSPGHVYLVAGGSTNSAATPSISVGNITTNGGGAPGTSGLAGGHLVLTTQQPNVSSTNPLVIDPVSGSILRGGILGGTMANSPISTGNITTGGGQVIIYSGMGITTGDIFTMGATTSTPSGGIALIANASGKNPAQSGIDVGNITTSSLAAGTGSAGRVFMMTSSDITVLDIDTSSTSAGGGSVYLLAGSTTGSGNITVNGDIVTTSDTQSSGEVVVISATGCTTCPTSGEIEIIGNIDTSSSGINSGSVTISTPGSMDVGSIDTRSQSNNGRSVFLAAGGNGSPGTGITAGDIDTSTLSGDSEAQAGGVYLLTTAMVDVSSVTQDQPSTTAANFIQQSYAPSLTSISGNSGTQTITLGPANTAPLAFAPGGYTSINDQTGTTKGNAIIRVEVANDDTVIVPLVSLGSFTLLGSAANPSAIETSSPAVANLAIVSGNGINIGSANAFMGVISGDPGISLKPVAATSGSVTINNISAFGQSLGVFGAASANGPLSIATRNGMIVIDAVSASVPSKGSSISLDVPGATDLGLYGNINAAGTVSLQPTGMGNITEAAPGVIGAPVLVIGNSSYAGGAGIPANPLFADVQKLTVKTDSTLRNAGASIALLNATTVNFDVGGSVILSGNSNIMLLPSIARSGVSVNANSIQVLSSSAPVLSSPLIVLTVADDIGSSALPLNVAKVTGFTSAPQLSISAIGDVFLISKGDLNFVGPSDGAQFSASTSGSIILTSSTITATTLTLKTGAAGGIVNTTTVALLDAPTVDLSLGKLGVGFSGAPGNQVQLSTDPVSSLRVVSTGSVRLFSNNDVTFTGASSAKGTNGFFMQGLGTNLTFADGASITAPKVDLRTGGTAGSITQLGANTAIVASSTTLLAGDVIDVRISGGSLLAASSTGSVTIDSTSTVSVLGPNGSAGASFSLTSAKDITLSDGGTIDADGIILQAAGSIKSAGSGATSALFSNDPIQLTATNGSIGTVAAPIPIDTGIGGLGTIVAASAPKGNVYLAGLSNTTAVGLTLNASNAKGTLSINSVAPITIAGISTAGGTVSISTLGSISGSGSTDFQAAAIVLTSAGAGTVPDPIRIAAPVGSTKPVNLTAVQSGDFLLVSSSGVNLVGTSSGSGDFTVATTSGNINMAAKASITTGNQLSLVASSGNITQSTKGTTLIAPILLLDGNNIGTSSVPVGATSAGSNVLVLGAVPSENAFVSVTGGVVVGVPATATGTYQLTTSGSNTLSPIQVEQNITAGSVVLKTLNNSSIAIADGVTVVGGSVTLDANGAGSITTSATGQIIATDLSLRSGSGFIGTSSTPINSTVSNTVQANVTTGNTGEVAISNVGNVTLLNSSAGSLFTFKNEGQTTVNSITTRAPKNLNTGTIFILTNSSGGTGDLNIAPGAKLTTSGGFMRIQNVDATAIIDIGKGARLTTKAQAGNGSIAVVVGPSIVTPIGGQTPPSGLTIKGPPGDYSLGSQPTGSSVDPVSPGNVITLNGQQVIFNTGAANTQSIKMEGSVMVNAGVGAEEREDDGEFVVDTADL